MFVNDREIFQENYFKKFIGALSREFGFTGIPMRVIIRDRERKAIKAKKGTFKINKADSVYNLKAEAAALDLREYLEKNPS